MHAQTHTYTACQLCTWCRRIGTEDLSNLSQTQTQRQLEAYQIIQIKRAFLVAHLWISLRTANCSNNSSLDPSLNNIVNTLMKIFHCTVTRKMTEAAITSVVTCSLPTHRLPAQLQLDVIIHSLALSLAISL